MNDHFSIRSLRASESSRSSGCANVQLEVAGKRRGLGMPWGCLVALRAQGPVSCRTAARMELSKPELNGISHRFNMGPARGIASQWETRSCAHRQLPA
jgi:hypothetical protein